MQTPNIEQPKNTIGFQNNGVESMTVPVEKKHNISKKKVIIFLLLLVIFLLTLTSIAYFLFYKAKVEPTEANADVYEVEENELEYVNKVHNFSLVIDKEWNVNEFGTKLEINTTNKGKISFESFNDQEFSAITSIDQKFCDSFGTGFREGLGNSEVSEQFDFVLFKNAGGLEGCEAQGEIIAGFKQRYNIFYNQTTKEVYTLFYTSSDLATEQELIDALDSFKVNVQ
jgi:hypothetical protein